MTLRCTTCQSTDVIAVKPGEEPEIAPGGIVIRRGRPDAAWCLKCWPCAPLQRSLFPEIGR